MNKKEIKVQKSVLSKNDRIAAELRELFAGRRLLAVNLLSSPGSGKTTLLEKTVQALGPAGGHGFSPGIAVVVGDLQTERDAARIRESGVPAVQIQTGGACHLDAARVDDALQRLDLDGIDVLFIENVGNLVCPAAFDLGEDLTVVLVSVTEGDDKPAKYFTAFRKADLVVINKIDLLPYTDFSGDRFKVDAGKIKPTLDILELSCTSELGLESWYEWLRTNVERKKQAPPQSAAGSW